MSEKRKKTIPENKVVRGKNFAYRIRRFLRDKGFKVIITSGSKPVDLVADKPGEHLYIECKVRPGKPSLRGQYLREYILSMEAERKFAIFVRNVDYTVDMYLYDSIPIEKLETTNPGYIKVKYKKGMKEKKRQTYYPASQRLKASETTS